MAEFCCPAPSPRPSRRACDERPLHPQRPALRNRTDLQRPRLASALLKADPATEVVIFLLGDAVTSAKAGQATPEGYYNTERMLRRVLSAHGQVLLCGTCMDARGLTETEMVEGASRSTMDALAAATMAADKVLTF